MGDRTKLDPGHELDDPCDINGISIRTSGEGQKQHEIDAGPDSGQRRRVSQRRCVRRARPHRA